MRIRRSVTSLLGPTYSTTSDTPPLGMAPPTDLLMLPPSLSHLVPCPMTKSQGGGSSSSPDVAFGERCELNCSAWDLIAELPLSDPRVEDDLMDKYFVHVTTRASWLFSPTVPAISTKNKKKKKKKKQKKQAMAGAGRVQPQSEQEKNSTMNTKVKKNQNRGQTKNTKVRQEVHEEGAAKVWKCKKNDGKRWQCKQKVSQPNSLCDYHYIKKCSYSNLGFSSAMEQEIEMVASQPIASKPSSGSKSKPQKMKSGNEFNVMEGFYYYAGFGFHNKRHYRSSIDDNVPISKEEEDSIKEEEEGRDALHLSLSEVESHDNETNQTAAFGVDIMGIMDIDKDSSDDDYNGISIAGSSMAGISTASNGGGKRKIQRKKLGKKPVKARSLMSLM